MPDCHEVVSHLPTLDCVPGAAVAALAVYFAVWTLCSLVLVAAVAFADRLGNKSDNSCFLFILIPI